MSELYNHLQKLQEIHQEILNAGVPLPTYGKPSEASPAAKRSKRRLLALSISCLVLGLLMAGAVVVVQKFSRNVVTTKREATIRVPIHVREHPPEDLRLRAEQTPKRSDVAQERESQIKGNAAKDKAALETVTDESGSTSQKDALPVAKNQTASDRFESPQTAPSEKTLRAFENTTVSSLVEGASTEESPSTRDETSATVPGFEHESMAQKPMDAEGELLRDAAVLALPTAPQAEFRSTAGGSPHEQEVATRGLDPLGAQSPRDGATDSARFLLVIAEEARRAGNWEEAVRAYREYLAQGNDPDVMNNLGAALMAQGRYGEAEEVLKQAHRRSTDPDIAANLATAYWVQGKREAACSLIQSLEENLLTGGAVQTVGLLVNQCHQKP
ncbi:tetratricopeptide repeat protein [Desulfosoma caldarium]|uniref:Tetratricopeptide repeat protein n=1 Tax=Desulfosoma caldarium TaxID=610254 RepID=A0A3N1US32_9BACT|nr:tetratricopeptide repeat protein [Desulfosoma caldarium]ROQ90661.1 tetratricopeptide repeat protein [Desulfosoma caldarium]